MQSRVALALRAALVVVSIAARAHGQRAAAPCHAGQHASARRCCADGSEWVAERRRCTAMPPEEACRHGHTAMCVPAAEALLAGTDGAIASQGVQLLRTGCEAGDAVACRRAGEVLGEGRVVPLDPTGAAALFDRACTAGELESCGRLATALALGRGVTTDVPRASDLAHRACARGIAAGCAALSDVADAYETGRGGTRDAAHAAAVYREACDARSGAACL
ncbi:MAG: tetratricopeptide repeat protein, partial [Deltaproteobacteria bacterium]